MDDSKSFLRHEVLNIITQLHFLIDDIDESFLEKKPLIKRLELLAFLGLEEQAILTGKKEFYKEKIDLHELLMIISDMLESDMEASQVILNIQGAPMTVEIDFECTKNSLNTLLKHLINQASEITVSLKPNTQQLTIEHNGDDLSLDLEQDFLELMKKGKESDQFLLQARLKLLKMSGTDIQIEKGKIHLKFQ